MKKTYRYLVLSVLMLAGLLLTACNGQIPAGVEVKAAPDGKSAQVEFTGTVSDISLTTWTIEGQPILIDGSTVVDGTFAAGDLVKVHAVVDSNGTVNATRIESPDASNNVDAKPEDSNNKPNEVTGKVDLMAEDSWTVNGQVYSVSVQTEINGNILAGDVVKIHFTTNPDGTLAATEIEKAGDNQAHNSVDNNGQNLNENELTGVVESINSDSWVVSGKTFTLTSGTEIKGAIAIGDTVKIHVFSAADGTLTVREIELAPGANNPGNSGKGMTAEDMMLTGTLEQIGTDQYVIGGQVVLITPQTILDSNLVIGSTVKVEVIVNPDGTFTAKKIETFNGSQNSGNSNSGKSNSGSSNSGSNSGNSGGSSSNDDHGNNSGSDSGHDNGDDHGNDGSNHD